MKVHSDIIILEILHLYFEATDEEEIDLENLKKSFYILINIINSKNDLNIKFNFQKELTKFLDNFSDYIEKREDKLVLLSEFKELFNAIIDSHDRLTLADYDCQSYVFNERIYGILNLSVPIEELEEYFNLNGEIIRAYLKLAENEYYSYYDKLAIEHLKDLIDSFNEKLNEADNSTLIKLKICYHHLNNSLLPNTEEKHINSVWNTILFSYNPKRLYSIAYNRLEFLVEMIDQKGDDEEEEILNSMFNEPESENEKLNDMSYFLTIVLIEINNYLSTHPNNTAKVALLIKKYLLLNAPELSHMEKYYLENLTINNYPEPPIPEDLDGNSFENLKNKVIECTTYLAIKNDDLTQPHLLAKAITSAIFIKVFLSVSINPDSIKDIIDLITYSIFYKKTNFEAVTAIVDEIIFGEPKSLTR